MSRMRWKNSCLSISLVFMLIVSVALPMLGFIGEIKAPIPPKVYVDPLTSFADPDEFFTVNLNISSVTGLHRWEIELVYNSTILYTDVAKMTEGPFLQGEGSTTWSPDAGTGWIYAECELAEGLSASGDGTLATVTFQVLNPGKSDLVLSYTALYDVNHAGITHEKEDGVFYSKSPTAEFTYTIGVPVTFNASDSKDYDGTIVSYTWDFDDGTLPVTETDPLTSHTYTAAGTYDVALTVTDDDGKTGTVTKPVVVIQVYVDPPSIVDPTIEPGDYVTFNVMVAGVTEERGVSSWEFYMMWDSSLLYSDYSLISEGDFLMNFEGPGGTKFTAKLVPEPPFPAIYMQVGCSLMDPVLAYGSGILAIISFEVLGEGGTSLDLYDTTLFDFWLIPIPHATQGGWFQNGNIPPTASFTYSPIPPLAGFPVTFNASDSQDLDGTIVKYDWEFGDETIANETDPITTHVYASNGTYTVKLYVTDDDELTHSAQLPLDVRIHDVAIIEVKPELFLVRPGTTIPINATVRNEGHFSETFNVSLYYDSTLIDTKTDVSLTSTSEKTLTFNWDTDVAEDTYTIKAAVPPVPGEPLSHQDDNNKTGGDILVKMGLPVASFTSSPEPARVDEIVTFDASASYDLEGDIVKYEWDFNDTTTATETDPITTHAYTAVGKYNVTLAVTDEDDPPNRVTITKTVTVTVHDIAITTVSTDPLLTAETGETVKITVRALNKGGFPETFDITLYRDGHVLRTWSSITLDAGESVDRRFDWNTTGIIGTQTISAKASEVQYETDTADNTGIASPDVTILGHNIAIESISVSPTTVTVRESMSIDVVVKNNGTYTETFNVTVYYNGSIIETRTNTVLEAGANETLTFTWNTTGVPSGNYEIKVEASQVPNEINPADNTKIYGIVTLEKSSSSISIKASPATITIGENTTLSGSLTPVIGGASVTIQIRRSGEQSWNNFTTVTTDQNGEYSHSWKPSEVGTYEVRATWSGDPSTLEATSIIETVTVQEATTPNVFLYAIAGVVIVIVTATLIYFIKFRKPK